MTTTLLANATSAKKSTAGRRVEHTPEQVGLNKLQEQLFRALNDEFGSKGWTVNTDLRYCTQIGCYPIDIIVPLAKQAAALPKVLKLQAHLSKDLGIQVFFVITAPE
jgi:hypothetical protein